MSVHRYPPQAGIADLARAGLGATLAAAPLLTLPLARWLTAVLIALLALFVCYAAAGLGRCVSSVETDNDGVRVAGLWRRRTVAWDRLHRLRLTYHSTRFDRERGWMTLSLAADDRVTFDSRIDGFADIVRRATAAAMRRQIPFDAPTRCNLRALGLAVPEPGGSGA
jgi:hypothetical protein